VIHAVTHLDTIKSQLSPFLCLLPRDSIELQRNGDILDRIQGRDQIECLKDKANLSAPEQSPLIVIQVAYVDAIEQNLTRCRRLDSPDDAHQGAFARPTRTHQGDKLACIDLQVNPFENIDRQVSGSELFRQVSDLDDRHQELA
jgi:hypothetical protein